VLALNFLLFGTAGKILVNKSSSIDEPLTPTKISQKPVSSKGAAPMRAVKLDTNGVYVSRNGSRVFMLSADANLYSIVPYAPTELTELYPEIGVPSFRRIAVQEHKDTRIHLVRGDGKVVVVVIDKLEQVNCLLMVETDGVIEDVVVLPGSTSSADRGSGLLPGQAHDQRRDQALPGEVGAGEPGDRRRRQPHRRLPQGLFGSPNHDAVGPVPSRGRGRGGVDRRRLPPGCQQRPGAVHGGRRAITVPTAATAFACVGLPYTAQWRSTKLASAPACRRR
jgi:hypothetical protein